MNNSLYLLVEMLQQGSIAHTQKKEKKEKKKRLFPILSLPLYTPLTAVCHTSFFFFSFFILKVDYFIRRKGDMWLITNGRA